MDDDDDEGGRRDRDAWGLGPTHGPYRGGRVHVVADRCSTCVFRPGNPMHLAAGRLKHLVDTNVANGSALTCHSTLGTDVPAVCHGFFTGPGLRHVLLLRLAVLLEMVEFDPPRSRTGIDRGEGEDERVGTGDVVPRGGVHRGDGVRRGGAGGPAGRADVRLSVDGGAEPVEDDGSYGHGGQVTVAGAAAWPTAAAAGGRARPGREVRGQGRG